MYRNIMVPLDGSELAECVIPHVEAIAQGCQTAKVSLVRVVEPVFMPSGGEYGISDKDRQRLEIEEVGAAQDYLKGLASRLNFGSIRVDTQVLQGKVADALADFANKNDIELIVVATHGRSGVSRWVWGSVAERLLRSACVPVLMIRAPGCFPGI